MPNIKPVRKYYRFSDEEMRAAAWCLNNNIAVSPIAIEGDGMNYYVEVINNGVRKNNGKKYRELESQAVMYEYYIYYYNKYAKT